MVLKKLGIDRNKDAEVENGPEDMGWWVGGRLNWDKEKV